MKYWLYIVLSGIMTPILVFNDNEEKEVADRFLELTDENSTDYKIRVPVGNTKLVNAYVVYGRASELPFPFFVVNSSGDMLFVNSYIEYIEREEYFL